MTDLIERLTALADEWERQGRMQALTIHERWQQSGMLACVRQLREVLPPQRQRIDVAVEGEPTVDGRLIEPGALHPRDSVISLGMMRDGERMQVGTGLYFQRDGGVISFEVRTSESLEGMNVTMDVDDALMDEKGDLLIIRRGRISGLFLSTLPQAWPRIDRRSQQLGESQ